MYVGYLDIETHIISIQFFMLKKDLLFLLLLLLSKYSVIRTISNLISIKNKYSVAAWKNKI